MRNKCSVCQVKHVKRGWTVRADAERNRQRVLDAAEEVLGREGLAASMRTIAAAAGVGLGTIYRHFPTQESLYQAIIADRMARLLAETEDDREFFDFFTRIVETATQKKVLADALADAGVDPKAGMAELGGLMRAAIEASLVQAQEHGSIRTDVTMTEVLALLAAACLAAERNQWSADLRTRTLAVMFDGLRAGRPARP
jgi:AcrR family transcriptional regulator